MKELLIRMPEEEFWGNSLLTTLKCRATRST